MIRTPQLPDGWRYERIKEAADLRFSSVDKHSLPGEVPVRLCNYVDVYRNERITPVLDFMEATATPSEIARFSLRDGDVLLTKDSETPNDIAVPACAAQSLGGVVCGYHLALLRPRREIIDGRFLQRALQATGVRDQFYAAAVGVTRYALGLDEVGSARVPVPPLPQQRAIADFLDRKTAAIDALIEKKQQMLDLVAEKRHAVIRQAVTKGLELSVPTQSSCVEWIGRIPNHWTCSPLGARYSVQLGKMLDSSRAPFGRDVPYLRNANVYWDGVDISDVHTMSMTPADLARYRLREGDLLVSEGGGNLNAVGKAAIWRAPIDECYYQKALHRLRPWDERRDCPEYLLFALRSAWAAGVFIADSNPNTVFHLTAEKLRQHRFPFPPAEEQRRIVAALQVEVGSLDASATAASKSLELLAEYRQALITAAVTGQLDVAAQEAA